MVNDCRQRDVGGLHTKQQAGLPIDLSDTAEHRVAHLQLDAQALVEGRLEQMSEQSPRGFIGQGLSRCRAEQQQGSVAGVGLHLMPEALAAEARGLVREAGGLSWQTGGRGFDRRFMGGRETDGQSLPTCAGPRRLRFIGA